MRLGVHLHLLLLLHLTTEAAGFKRCAKRKPNPRCTYTCNRITGDWRERSCKAAAEPTSSATTVTSVDGLKSCSGQRPGKFTGACGYTCNRKQGMWKDKPCSGGAPGIISKPRTFNCLNAVGIFWMSLWSKG